MVNFMKYEIVKMRNRYCSCTTVVYIVFGFETNLLENGIFPVEGLYVYLVGLPCSRITSEVSALDILPTQKNIININLDEGSK